MSSIKSDDTAQLIHVRLSKNLLRDVAIFGAKEGYSKPQAIELLLTVGLEAMSTPSTTVEKAAREGVDA